MFRHDNVLVMTIVIILGILALFGSLFYTIVRAHEIDSRTRRAHYTACATIGDERLRRDCLNGPVYGSSYPQ